MKTYAIREIIDGLFDLRWGGTKDHEAPRRRGAVWGFLKSEPLSAETKPKGKSKCFYGIGKK